MSEIGYDEILKMSSQNIEDLPRSFEEDYKTNGVLSKVLSDMGVIRGYEVRGISADRVEAVGKLPDGTIVRICMTKGANYSSPQGIAYDIGSKIKSSNSVLE